MSEVTIFACGPSTDKCRCECPNGPCEHKWDGPKLAISDNRGVSVTCSRCGMDAWAHDLWIVAP